MSAQNRKHNPQEAAEFLARNGTPFTHKTLAVWRSQNHGPAYIKLKGRIFYSEEALEKFAEGRVIETTDSFERS